MITIQIRIAGVWSDYATVSVAESGAALKELKGKGLEVRVK